MNTIPRNRDSDEFLRVEVTADVDLTMPVAIAVTRVAVQPVSGDWKTAEWFGTVGTKRKARIPPSDVSSLTPGTWKVWVRLTDNPEVPVIHSGFLKIT